MLDPNLQLVLPFLAERLCQLYLKLADYERRMRKCTDPTLWMKFDLVLLLLAHKVVRYTDFYARQCVLFAGRLDNVQVMEKTEKAWFVVSDYCETGGKANSKSLPDVRRPIPGEGFAVNGWRAIITTDFFGGSDASELTLGEEGFDRFNPPVHIPAYMVGTAVLVAIEPDICLVSFVIPEPAISSNESLLLVAKYGDFPGVEVSIPIDHCLLEVPK